MIIAINNSIQVVFARKSYLVISQLFISTLHYRAPSTKTCLNDGVCSSCGECICKRDIENVNLNFIPAGLAADFLTLIISLFSL